MHGGAKGSGAPIANQNALRHGTYTQEAVQQRRAMDEMWREMILARNVVAQNSIAFVKSVQYPFLVAPLGRPYRLGR